MVTSKQLYAKKNLIFRTNNYIRKTLAEEYAAVSSMYQAHFNPFHAWVVANLEEEQIQCFVETHFEKYGQSNISKQENAVWQLELHLLFDAITHLQNPANIQTKKINAVLPKNPKNFTKKHWLSIRERYELLRKEDQSIFSWRIDDGTLSTPGSTDSPNNGKSFMQKQKGTVSLNTDFHKNNDEFVYPEIESRMQGKQIVGANDYLLITTKEMYANLVHYNIPEQNIKIVFQDASKLSFRMAILLPFAAEREGKRCIDLKNSVKAYLNAKYLEVKTELHTKYISELAQNISYLEAHFSVERQKITVSHLQELYYIPSDELYVEG